MQRSSDSVIEIYLTSAACYNWLSNSIPSPSLNVLCTFPQLTSPQSTLAMSKSTSTTTPDLPTPALQWTRMGMDGLYRCLSDRMSTRKSGNKERDLLSHIQLSHYSSKFAIHILHLFHCWQPHGQYLTTYIQH